MVFSKIIKIQIEPPKEFKANIPEKKKDAAKSKPEMDEC